MSYLRTFFKGLGRVEKSIFAFIYIVVQVFPASKLAAQNTGDYRVDKTEPYELVAPSLSTLHTNLVFSKEEQLQTTSYGINSKRDSVIIVGDLITSDILLEYVKTDILAELDVTKLKPAERYRDSVLMKSLSIHCDSFSFNKSLWLPGVNVSIHARVINWGNNNILRTTPRPWREDKRATKAKNGTDAGNIEIICEYVTGGTPNLEANGGNGQGVQFGTPTFTPLQDLTEIHVYDCMADLTQISTCYFKRTFSPGVAGVLYKPGVSHYTFMFIKYKDSKNCPTSGYTFLSNNQGTATTSGNYSGLYYSNNTIYDGMAAKRLDWEVCKGRKPGKGGNAGKVNVHAQTAFSYNVLLGTGYEGPFYIPEPVTTSDIEVKYEKKDSIITGNIALVQKKGHLIYKGDLNSYERAGVGICPKDHRFEENSSENIYFDKCSTIDGKNAWVDFEKSYKEYKYNEPVKDKTTPSAVNFVFTPSTIYLRHKLTLEKNKIKDFQSLSPKDTAAVLKNLRAIARNIGQLKAACKKMVDSAPDATAKNYYSFKLIEAEKLQAELDMAAQNVTAQRYLDEFNNPLGYRPVLSFTAIYNFMKNNLDTDLRLYIEANEAMKNIKDREAFLVSIDKLKEALNNGINMGYADLGKMDRVIDSLGKEGLILQKDAQSLNDSLVSLEIRLRADAKALSDEERLWRIGAKVLAVGGACAATAFGGPTAGALTYNMVDKLGNAAVNAGYDDKVSNAQAAQRDVNIMPLLGGIKSLKLEPVQSELRVLDYRKNYLFNDMKDWKPDAMVEDGEEFRDYIRTELPQSLQQYIKRKDELDSKLTKLTERRNKINTMASFAVKGGEEIYSTFTRTDMLDNAINRVVNQSVEYREMGEMIKYNARKYGEFAMSLRAAIIEKGEIMNRMIELSEQRQRLLSIQQDPEAFLDPLLANNMARIETQALRRLKWMEYQLVNVYNYTMLTPYPEDSITNFRLLASRELANIKKIEDKVQKMSSAYKGHLQNIKSDIVVKAKKGHNMDDINGVKIIFNEDDSPEVLAALNDEQQYTFDLYNDFSNIVQPDKSNIRIVSVGLDEFELSRSLRDNETLTLTIELDDEGILRKDDKLYRFKDDANAVETWKWDFNVPNKGSSAQAQTTATVPSKIYEDMLRSLVDDKNKGRGSDYLFTLKPAWSKMTISLVKTGLKEPVEIKRLKLKVIRDYETSAPNYKVCDLRVKAEETDVQLVVKKGTNRPDTLGHSQYNIVTPNTSFQLEAYTVDTTRVFSHWETTPAKLGQDVSGNVLNFNVKDVNVFVRPVFKTKAPKVVLKTSMPVTVPPSMAGTKSISLYKTRQLNAPAVVSLPFDFFKEKLRPVTVKNSGFYSVVYEYEEYFVHKKDLE